MTEIPGASALGPPLVAPAPLPASGSVKPLAPLDATRFNPTLPTQSLTFESNSPQGMKASHQVLMAIGQKAKAELLSSTNKIPRNSEGVAAVAEEPPFKILRIEVSADEFKAKISDLVIQVHKLINTKFDEQDKALSAYQAAIDEYLKLVQEIEKRGAVPAEAEASSSAAPPSTPAPAGVTMAELEEVLSPIRQGLAALQAESDKYPPDQARVNRTLVQQQAAVEKQVNEGLAAQRRVILWMRDFLALREKQQIAAAEADVVVQQSLKNLLDSVELTVVMPQNQS